jgi:hypothetical protein
MYGDPLVNAVQAGHSVIRGRRQEGEKGHQQRHRCTMLRSEHMDAGPVPVVVARMTLRPSAQLWPINRTSLIRP